MTFLTVNYETQQAILDSFDQIANKISNEVQLKINDGLYRIVDFEFYTYSTNLPDPHTYKNKLQLESSKLYLHGSGIDITFGDGVNHGGILLRSVVKLFDGAKDIGGFLKEQFEGPQVVATELFSNLHPLNSFQKNDIEIIDIQSRNQDSLFVPAEYVINTKRVGLTPKPGDVNDFYLKLPLRYIAILPKSNNFKQKIKGIESILSELVLSGRMEEQKAIEILGYNKTF